METHYLGCRVLLLRVLGSGFRVLGVDARVVVLTIRRENGNHTLSCNRFGCWVQRNPSQTTFGMKGGGVPKLSSRSLGSPGISCCSGFRV